MAATPPSNSNPTGESPTTPLTFEDNINQFWQKNRMVVLGLCILVLVVILGKGGWEHVQKSRELEVEQAYAAATTPDQLRAFASAHPEHELAGVAEVRIADQAYAAGKATDAVAGYDKALAVLKDGPLASRAKLGRALAKIQAGKASEAESELKQLAGDAGQFKAVRSEAAYNLASLAAEAGNAADVQKYIEQLNQIDQAGVWARRAMSLQASLPRSNTLPAPAAPATPAPGNAQGGPNVQLKLPAK